MLKLEQEESARLRIEKQLNDVTALSNKVKRLDALNEIFGGLDDTANGLTKAQNKESITRAMETHFKNVAVTQNLTDETLRELVLQVQLILENNNSNSGSANNSRKSVPSPNSASNDSNRNSATVKNSRIDDGDDPVRHSHSRRNGNTDVNVPAACCVIS